MTYKLFGILPINYACDDLLPLFLNMKLESPSFLWKLRSTESQKGHICREKKGSEDNFSDELSEINEKTQYPHII